MNYVTGNRRRKKVSSHIPYFIFHTPSRSGFTIIEMIIAFAIFAIVMVISVGSFVSLMEANHKAQTLKTVVNNLHFALENISRNVRTGTNYHCGFSGSPIDPRDCASEPSSRLIFRARSGEYVLYELSAGAILRAKDKNPSALLVFENRIPITAPEVAIDTLNFYVDGADNTDDKAGNKKQPRVLMVVKGSMKGKSKVPSRFDIQTLVSQRSLDI